MQDIDPEKRAEALETAALGGTQTICGLELRPMTLGTWSLHRRIKSAAGESYGDDWSFDLLSFVYIHNVPEETLRAAFGKPQALLPSIYDFMAIRPVSDVPQFQPWVKDQMEAFTAGLTASENGTAGLADPKI
jgi:hypothetical protein